jgi:hypothetical protein
MEIIFSLFIIPLNDLKISMFCKVHLPTNLFFQDLSTLKILKKVFSKVLYGENGKKILTST